MMQGQSLWTITFIQVTSKSSLPGPYRDLPTPGPSQAVLCHRDGEFESNSLSGTCSGMDRTVWIKVQVLVYVYIWDISACICTVCACMCMYEHKLE